ncbi:UNVERIFIED_CONTAM: hypothetical protein GTU68_028116 [Idotea baltica]|nr:hypothetical protein [Idotea baltica]
MKFIDEADIHVKAGDGGSGSKHFHREKFVPLGGPDGGNGGNGGSIILKADQDTQTLVDFKFQAIWKADDGNAGDKRLKDGKSGEDLIILVPIGTQVFNQEKELVCDLKEKDNIFVLAKGGKGGKGNSFFKSSTNRSPDYSQSGTEGEEGNYKLSLKLVADVGLIGFPNAGKSTFISVVSAAKPKIADYPFTTLQPNLGVVKTKNQKSFVLADIPGLIPDAHKGKGLGIQFLKHVERTKVLLHLIDTNNELYGSPLEQYKKLNFELKNFSNILNNKKQIIAITKSDTLDEEKIKEIKKEFKEINQDIFIISSVKKENLDQLIFKLEDILSLNKELE